MIKIAYVIDAIESPYAGTEKQLLEMIARMDLSRFEPHLICLRNSAWLSRSKLNCPTQVLEFQSFKGLDYFRCGRRFARYCQEHGIQIVQTFFHDANIVGTLWATKAGVGNVIASRRNIGRGYWHSYWRICMLRWLRHRTDQVIANSQAAADEAVTVERIDPVRVTVIPNGLDLSAFEPPGDSEIQRIRSKWGFGQKHIVVGAVANLRPVKNLAFLIRAAQNLVNEYPEVRFVVLGEGEQRSELEREIAQAGLGRQFCLPGRSEEVTKELYGFDIAVLVSHGESLSNSLLEYLAAGRPAVVSDVGGNREVITSESIGLVYPPDQLSTFVRHVGRLIESSSERLSLGSCAREHVASCYSFEKVVTSHQEIYSRLIIGS